jgi:indoleamine 2,3-dioxygenase
MRDYMPRGHRRFLTAVEREQDICSYVRTQQHNDCLYKSYTSCLDALTRFRDLHIQMVTRYVVIPAKKGRAMVETSSLPVSIAGANGTGGTRPIEFLKSVRDDVVCATRGRGWKLV